jgi:TetR/AcrR family transcriptional regulator, acrAB operon repressor
MRYDVALSGRGLDVGRTTFRRAARAGPAEGRSRYATTVPFSPLADYCGFCNRHPFHSRPSVKFADTFCRTGCRLPALEATGVAAYNPGIGAPALRRHVQIPRRQGGSAGEARHRPGYSPPCVRAAAGARGDCGCRRGVVPGQRHPARTPRIAATGRRRGTTEEAAAEGGWRVARHTKEQAEQTREAIIDAAEQVFFRRGVARASLEQIAREAGVTRGAVYWHFRDKLDLFLAIEERVRLPQEEMLARLAQSPPGDALANLQNWVTSTFRLYDTGEKKRVQLTVLLLRCDYVDEMAPALDRQAALLSHFAVELRRFFCEVLPPPAPGCDWDPATAAHVFQTLVHGAILRWLRSPAQFPLSSNGIAAVEGFLVALRRSWARAG